MKIFKLKAQHFSSQAALEEAINEFEALQVTSSFSSSAKNGQVQSAGVELRWSQKLMMIMMKSNQTLKQMASQRGKGHLRPRDKPSFRAKFRRLSQRSRTFLRNWRVLIQNYQASTDVQEIAVGGYVTSEEETSVKGALLNEAESKISRTIQAS
jgi:hypothetical protein